LPQLLRLEREQALAESLHGFGIALAGRTARPLGPLR